MYDVRATNGNTRLGGINIDSNIVDYCVDHLKDDMCDIESSEEGMQMLKSACEEAKKQLSSMDNAKVVVDWIEGDDKYEIPIDRNTFENLIEGIVSKTISCVEDVIRYAHLEKNDIHDIILVGGSTLIPKIRLEIEKFVGLKPNTSLNPLEAGM